MNYYETEQERFWAGSFGDEYVKRNRDRKHIVSNIALFSKILSRTYNINSCLELGANIGNNLIALGQLLPDLKMQAVEINESAAKQCAEIPNVSVFNGTIFDYAFEEEGFDLTFTKGVLIHIAPEKLEQIYDILYRASRKYILVCEYYNPSPVEITYRGNEGKLFKRDFAGEIMDKYPGLSLIDYGFIYYRDNYFAQDDLTWFLMEKK